MRPPAGQTQDWSPDSHVRAFLASDRIRADMAVRAPVQFTGRRTESASSVHLEKNQQILFDACAVEPLNDAQFFESAHNRLCAEREHVP